MSKYVIKYIIKFADLLKCNFFSVVASPSEAPPQYFLQVAVMPLLAGTYTCILLGEERHCENTQCLALEPRPLDPESNSLTIRSPCLSRFHV